MVDYAIISTGSKGNATVIEKSVLVDCGVPYKAISPYVGGLKLVLLSHIHSDHFKVSTIRRLAKERPTLRFACGPWLKEPLLSAGVSRRNIDVMAYGSIYTYSFCNVIPIPLTHDVPNCGWKVHFPAGKVIYATDTANLNGIKAPNYDLYLIEANHEESEIQTKIAAKKEAGEFAYEIRAAKTHLSEQQCLDFLQKNMGRTSQYVYMHQHEDKP